MSKNSWWVLGMLLAVPGFSAPAEESKPPHVEVLFVLDQSAWTKKLHENVAVGVEPIFRKLAFEKKSWNVDLRSYDVRSLYLKEGSTNWYDLLDSRFFDAKEGSAELQRALKSLRLEAEGAKVSSTMLGGLYEIMPMSVKHEKPFPNFTERVAIVLVADSPATLASPKINENTILTRIMNNGIPLERVRIYGFFGGQEFGCKSSGEPWQYAGSAYEVLIRATGGAAFSGCGDTEAAFNKIAQFL